MAASSRPLMAILSDHLGASLIEMVDRVQLLQHNSQAGKIMPVIRVSLTHAARVQYSYARYPQSHQSHAHRDAMIRVGLDPGRTEAFRRHRGYRRDVSLFCRQARGEA